MCGFCPGSSTIGNDTNATVVAVPLVGGECAGKVRAPCLQIKQPNVSKAFKRGMTYEEREEEMGISFGQRRRRTGNKNYFGRGAIKKSLGQPGGLAGLTDAPAISIAVFWCTLWAAVWFPFLAYCGHAFLCGLLYRRYLSDPNVNESGFLQVVELQKPVPRRDDGKKIRKPKPKRKPLAMRIVDYFTLKMDPREDQPDSIKINENLRTFVI